MDTQEGLIKSLLSLVPYDIRDAAEKDLQTILEMERSKYEAIGSLHRPSGRLGGDGQVSFLQEAFAIPLAVHGTLKVYMRRDR